MSKHEHPWPFWVNKHGRMGIDLSKQAGIDGLIGTFSAEEIDFANDAFGAWEVVVGDVVNAYDGLIQCLANTSGHGQPLSEALAILGAAIRKALPS